MGVARVTLSYVIIVCLMSFNTACYICCKCGSVTPNDPYYFIDEASNVICSLDKPHPKENASDLYIIFNDTEVDSSFITTLNDSAMLFNKTMTMEDEGKYYCRIRGVEGIEGLVGGQIVTVDYPLETVSDIQCIWHNWKDRLVCRWTLPPYRHKRFIDVELVMYNGANITCPDMLNKNECTWNPGDAAIDLNQVGFLLKVTNMNRHKNISMLGPWIIKTRDENVKPQAVESFSHKFTNRSTCLLLTWKYDSVSSSREKHYRVQYTPVGDPSRKNTVWSDAQNMTVCNLNPYTLYTFTIAVHPDRAAVKGYWSDPVTNIIQTDQDVPGAAPDMVGFRQPSESCIQEGKTPAGFSSMIYFKSVPEVERNGLITNYRINYTELTKGTVYTKIISNQNSTSVHLHLHCNLLYNISIAAATVKGYSPHHSSLIINTAGMSPATVMVERNASLYNVSWTVPGSVNFLTSYTVVYCTMVGSQQECAGELQKVDVPDSQTRHQTLSLTPDTAYLFGVSVVRSGVASAAKLESCIYVSTETPSTPQFSVDESIGEDSLRVTWDPLTCNNKQPYVTSFTIEWCPTSDKLEEQCVGPRRSVVIPSTSKSEYIIRDLEKDKRYGVTMLSSSLSQTSLRSEMKYGTATNNDLETGEIAGIALAGFVVFIFIIAGLFFVWKVVKQRCREAKTPFDIDTPEVEKGSSSGLHNFGSSTSSDEPLIRPTTDHAHNYIIISDEHQNLMDANNEQDAFCHTNVAMRPQLLTQFSKDSGHGGSVSTEPESPSHLFPVPEDGPFNDKEEPVGTPAEGTSTSTGPSSGSNPYIQVGNIPHQQLPGEQHRPQVPVEDRTETDSTETHSSQRVHIDHTNITVAFVMPSSQIPAGTNTGYIAHAFVSPRPAGTPSEYITNGQAMSMPDCTIQPDKDVSAPEINTSGNAEYIKITGQSQSFPTQEGPHNTTLPSSSPPEGPHSTTLPTSSPYVDSTTVQGPASSPYVHSTNVHGPSSSPVDPHSTTLPSSSSPEGPHSTTLPSSSPPEGPHNTTLPSSSPPEGPHNTTLPSSSPPEGPHNTTLPSSSPPEGPHNTTLPSSSPYVDSTTVKGPASSPYVDSTNVSRPSPSPNVVSTTVQGPPSSPYVDSTTVKGPSSSPYVDSTNVSSPPSSPYVDSTNVSGPSSSPYVDSTNVSSPPSSPFVDSTTVQGPSSSPYVDSTNVSSPPSSPYVDSTNVSSPPSSPYVGTTNVRSPPSSPYVDSTNVSSPPSSPYVDSTNVSSPPSSPYVDSTTVQGPASSPYVGTTNIHGFSSSLNVVSTTVQGPASSPYVDSTNVSSPPSSLYVDSTTVKGPASSPYVDSTNVSGPSSSPPEGPHNTTLPSSSPPEGTHNTTLPSSSPYVHSTNVSGPSSSPPEGPHNTTLPSSSPPEGPHNTTLPSSSPYVHSTNVHGPSSPPQEGPHNTTLPSSSPQEGPHNTTLPSSSPPEGPHNTTLPSSSPPEGSHNTTLPSSSPPEGPHNTTLPSSSPYVHSTNVHGPSTSPLTDQHSLSSLSS